MIKVDIGNILSDADQVGRSRLLSAAEKDSSMWLHAVHLPQLGTQLDPDSLTVAIVSRLRAALCEPHVCRR